MKKLLFLILTFMFTVSASYATEVNELKAQVEKLYQIKLKEFPNIKLTERRFQEVVSNPEHKEELEKIYKSRLEFLSDEHKLKRNEYLSKSILECAKEVFRLSAENKKDDVQKTFEGYYKYLYEVSNIDKKHDDLLHIFYSSKSHWRFHGLDLFTPTFILSTISSSYDPYGPQNFVKEALDNYEKRGYVHIFKMTNNDKAKYNILIIGKEFWYVIDLSEDEKDELLQNYKNSKYLSYMQNTTANLSYTNPNTKTSIVVYNLYKYKVKK
ncbi:MAG: hypothetical protein GY793_04265 [Proteobacteria bacterium]|nr:hypothetical protein [Pseudomonadota bacterium]